MMKLLFEVVVFVFSCSFEIGSVCSFQATALTVLFHFFQVSVSSNLFLSDLPGLRAIFSICALVLMRPHDFIKF